MATQEQTAKGIWDYLTNRGWTKESVAALLGNMQSESGIIADRWESDIVGNMRGGYGLVQWTPANKYIDWAKSNGLVYQDTISQCKRLEWEVANGQQFFHPTMTFKQFTQSTQSPETLADIFIRYYERPYNPNQPARQVQARYWFNKLKDSSNGGNSVGEEETNKTKGEVTMQCIYWKPSATNPNPSNAYYFNGVDTVYIPSLDTISILKTIYKDNNGKDMPEYKWGSNAPWHVRLEAVAPNRK
ncbi:phage tail tip lysozyme [Carnobacterium maltaromaticum]|uniref:phage tail tip lysozyme n=1 Tax=Carnobacterium maltaromaticum TaxID=2751 RepID=UPI000E7720A8|nr:phage tail tip lysozyme [Carnobacterium maltaromaticum]AOA02712.1 hypothetical protein BFC23_09490 [Carnobacterium maltaromaticum]MCI1819561.1 phage tail tip lysozyme [Carnobacterium maltaromaticum]